MKSSVRKILEMVRLREIEIDDGTNRIMTMLGAKKSGNKILQSLFNLLR